MWGTTLDATNPNWLLPKVESPGEEIYRLFISIFQTIEQDYKGVCSGMRISEWLWAKLPHTMLLVLQKPCTLFKNRLSLAFEHRSINRRNFSLIGWQTFKNQSQNTWFSNDHKYGSTRPSPPQGVHFSDCTIETNLLHVQVEDVAAICISKQENAQIFGGRRGEDLRKRCG